MEEWEVIDLLEDAGAFVRNTHIIGTSGNHLSAYINKDAVYTHTNLTSRLAEEIAKRFADGSVEAVAAPAVGGAILGQWVAHHLQKFLGREILAVYADKIDSGLQLKRGYDRIVQNRNVLVVEDIVNTGGSARKVIEAVRHAGGSVLGLGAISSRGDASLKDLGDPPQFKPLMTTILDIWSPEECPLCKQGVPINLEIGKAKAFESAG